MKNIAILGATGSIGRNTLAIVEMFPERFAVKALTAKENIELLADQIEQFAPDLAVVYDDAGARRLKSALPSGVGTEIMVGDEGYKTAATLGGVDIVVSAMVGGAGLLPTLAAIHAGKDLALANKEALVMAGDLVMREAARANIEIRPVDSEHSAIFQCLCGNRREDLRKVILTASGGPFRTLPRERFPLITPRDALAHPTWEMGTKISIDSATLMNKGLEVIEAAHLFDVAHHSIEVVIHPQSIVHSMVSYRDGSVIAQMGIPDMKGAIAYALSGPERLQMQIPPPDYKSLGALTFEAPDMEHFPCLDLAYRACAAGGTVPAVMNAANEAAVDAFLREQIGFLQIPIAIEAVMAAHGQVSSPDMADILQADQWARRAAVQWVDRNGKGLVK
ncbi:MAG: 1-deoxy-D-xylulose-5-phosphate reductoisomerase [Desulfobacterales bacterium]|nr:1-deoxy-D-xylulose-5-phosphate reductoisomerase [Desulfobacterales bacterium]